MNKIIDNAVSPKNKIALATMNTGLFEGDVLDTEWADFLWNNSFLSRFLNSANLTTENTKRSPTINLDDLSKWIIEKKESENK